MLQLVFGLTLHCSAQPRESRWFASCFQTNVSKFCFLQLTFGPEAKTFKAVTVLHNQAPLSAGGDVGCGSAEVAPLFAFPNKSIAFDSTLSAAGQLLMSRFSRRIVRRLVGLSAVSCINRLKCIRSHLGKYWWASDGFCLATSVDGCLLVTTLFITIWIFPLGVWTLSLCFCEMHHRFLLFCSTSPGQTRVYLSSIMF